MEDTRNVIDAYKGVPIEDIVSDLDESRVPLEIAIENLSRDFNMGTIVRTANAFNVAKIHIVGRRQWNKRGAMKTDAYMHVQYHDSVESLMDYSKQNNKIVVAADIVPQSKPLGETSLPENALIVFGAEGPGISNEMLTVADRVIHVEQFGSTRSMNVGVAAGIVMYAWVQRNILTKR